MFITPCGKTYKRKYWYDKHVSRCPDCINIATPKVVQKHQRDFAEKNIRIALVVIGTIIALVTIWRAK